MAEPGLSHPLERIIGGKSATTIEKAFGYQSVGDLLNHFPRRYAERGELTDLSALREGDEATVLAEVKAVSERPMRGRKGTILTVTVTDAKDTLTLTFFNQRWLKNTLAVGRRGLFAGTVSTYGRQRQLTHPEYVILDDDQATDTAADASVELFSQVAGRLIPIYPAKGRLTSWRIATAMKVVVDSLPTLAEPIPAALRKREGLGGLREAYRSIHFPEDFDEVDRAKSYFRFEEALTLQTVLAQRRAAVRAMSAVPRSAIAGGLLDDFDQRLPFVLTQGQQDVGATIATDLGRTYPMHRLLQGEVGSGKTVVALRAMLTVVDTGGQAALLAPTEVLAQQHARSITAMLGPLAEAGMLGHDGPGTEVCVLTGSASTQSRKKAMLDIASGTAGIVIGTHALLQQNVEFFDLGLVVVDEQHRFGVEQRDALRAKGRTPPHVLVMTATPIPRTVAMSVFGDLEVSTLAELPAGRQQISCHVVPSAEKPHFLERTWQRVREEVEAGNQVFVVCPRIGGAVSDSQDAPDDGREGAAEGSATWATAPAVLDIAPMLSEGPLKGLRTEILHGQLPADVKDDVMRRFVAGDIDVLVSTTVIEVGVDVPAATVMVVMGAERFGVSQLHQLRGRVGRGGREGLCLFVTEAPEESPARERLTSVAATSDGFALARLDLEQRREGDVLGTSQSGFRSSLRVLSVLRDEDVIARARDDAQDLVADDPELANHPALRDVVAELVAADQADYLEKT